jgi:hypothetical protein
MYRENPETGGYDLVIEPQASGQSATEDARNYEYWQDLLARGDTEGAAAFAQAANLSPRESANLPAAYQQRLISLNDSTLQSNLDARNYAQLADQLDANPFEGGWAEQGATWLRTATGNRTNIDTLKTEYERIRGANVVQNLPPGAASDTDIQMFLRGFPPDGASSAEIASFLRGMSKAAAESAKYSRAEADYIHETGSVRGFLERWDQMVGEQDSEPEVEEWYRDENGRLRKR